MNKKAKLVKKGGGTAQQDDSYYYDYITLLIIIGYLIIDFLPNFGRGEIAKPQFLYLNILNVIVASIIIITPKLRQNFSFSILKKNYVFIAYIAFLLISGISVFTAKNHTLGIVSFANLMVVFMAFLNLVVLLFGRLHLIYKIAFIVGVAAFFQAGKVVMDIWNLQESEEVAKS
ncbi:MAG: hypothetical protein WCY89_11860, partial [Flavobacteriaceae bacterium]